MGTRTMRLALIGGLILAMLVIAGPAAAHEERTVGPFEMVVGFGQEPAYAGQPNSVQLLLSRGGKPVVTDLVDGLSVSVGFGDSSKDVAIEPFFEIGEFGTPGDYRAWFIPTRPGTYSFHFTGTIGSTEVDETFTSGPKTFDDVANPTDAEFPAQDPTNGELAERIDREVPRLQSSIRDAKGAAAGAADDATSARTLALVGVVVGALGVIAGIAGIVSARRTPA